MVQHSRSIRDGLVVGFIAYLTVAAFYSIFDFLAARGSLYTVNLLGRAVFRGLRDPAVLQYPVQLDTTAIFLYNGVHFVASLAIGLTVMALVAHAERHPPRAGAILGVIIAGFVATIAVVGWLSVPIRPVLPWWSIVLANSLAVLAAAVYVLRRRTEPWNRFIPLHSQPAETAADKAAAPPNVIR
jgi:hypothetical protein